MKFEVKRNQFYKNDKPIKIISGSVHYFRNMPATWGEYDFTGILDVAGFIKKAEAEGLMVIVRPGPYICAEWEFGGLPWWIQQDEDVEIRCSNPIYIKHFERYLDRLFEEVRPSLYTNGGSVIMMQCENEYGYYGDDKQYLQHLYDFYRGRGIDVPLFTSDGTSKNDILDGSIEGCFETLNFGSRVEKSFAAHDELFPNQPKMCMEMWDGWFDAWGDAKHHTTSARDYAGVVDDMLKKGSLNMYMFIGGTNFGFTNGANHYEKFAPDVTSYDYDALLSECGDVTDKYYAVREVIKKYVNEPLLEVPPYRTKAAYGKIRLTQYGGLFDNLDNLSSPVSSEIPRCMEKYGQGYGYIAYQTILNREYENAVLKFENIGDRAQIYINKQLQGIVYVNDEKLEICFNAKQGDTLTILCENMGRANFGPKMMRKKGIDGRCLIDGRVHFGWNVYTLPMDNVGNVVYQNKKAPENSLFCKGIFEVGEANDTFLKLDNFRKGFVLINGFNIGRYWEIGPQQTLYVPVSLLKQGVNEIVVFESDGLKGECEVEFVDKPCLG